MTKNGIWNGDEYKSDTVFTRCIDFECNVVEKVLEDVYCVLF